MVCACHWPRVGVLAVALLTLVSACAQRSRTCLPPDFTTSARYHDLNASPSAGRAVDADLEEEILARFRGQGNSASAKPTGKCYRILALSGGGANGAYTVGVLNGWSATGTRPTFDVVTGISTGGLIATYAFLGQAYDGALRDMYTSVTSDDIYQKRPRVAILWSESVATAGPLRRLIDEQISCEVLRQVAAAHAQGRRLYIGTTNLDTRRLVVWDMGAIASSGRPESIELYRTIVLASASVPGFFPPVPIEVQINGKPYKELHADGGTTSEVFLRGSMLNIDREAVRGGKQPLVGSDVYIIKAGKLYADPSCVKPRLPNIASGAVEALMGSHGRNDIGRIWMLATLTGMGFHLTSIPQELPVPTDSLKFDPAEMKRLYEAGYQLARAGRVWRTTPPDFRENEQVIPRAGTQFIGPAAPSSSSLLQR